MVEPLTQVERYYAHYEAVVTRKDDPKKLNRVKLRVKDVMGNAESAWARVVTPFAGPQRGVLFTPEPGDYVVAVFEAGDVNRPLVIGSLWNEPGGTTQIPDEAQKASTAVPRGQDSAATALGGEITEPADGRAPAYPTNHVIVTQNHSIELDDTAGKERISITHKKAKFYFDIYSDGTVVFGVPGQRYVVVGTNDAEHIKGNKDVVVDGNFSLMTQDQKIQGANRTIILDEDSLTANKLTIQIGGDISIQGATAELVAALVALGPGVTPGAVVTTITHPVDYITGIPIVGVPTVLAG